ncbi:hypothetical protein [Proteus mirabilis]|uniref:hypothetical protein n=1 Tax=Proteus mirabilis TaxID=584 RepID=UPI0034D680DD
MGKLTAKNRKQVEKLIDDTLRKLDPSGMNADKYKRIFKDMSDAEFVKMFTRIKENREDHLYVETDVYGKNKITLDSIKTTANFLKVPLEEYVYIRHKTKDGTPIRSRFKVPVMYVHMKRMQQLLSKKTKMSIDIDEGNTRSRITGSLNHDNKSGRFTDADLNALLSVTYDTGFTDADGIDESPIVKELLSGRADNMENKNRMAQDISLFGTTSINNFDPNTVGQAVNTLDIFYTGAGFKTDLVEKTLTKNV